MVKYKKENAHRKRSEARLLEMIRMEWLILIDEIDYIYIEV